MTACHSRLYRAVDWRSARSEKRIPKPLHLGGLQGIGGQALIALAQNSLCLFLGYRFAALLAVEEVGALP